MCLNISCFRIELGKEVELHFHFGFCCISERDVVDWERNVANPKIISVATERENSCPKVGLYL